MAVYAVFRSTVPLGIDIFTVASQVQGRTFTTAQEYLIPQADVPISTIGRYWAVVPDMVSDLCQIPFSIAAVDVDAVIVTLKVVDRVTPPSVYVAATVIDCCELTDEAVNAPDDEMDA